MSTPTEPLGPRPDGIAADTEIALRRGIDQAKRPTCPPWDDATEQGARVRAMLARWEADDASDEPDWDVEEIEPIRSAVDSKAEPERK